MIAPPLTPSRTRAGQRPALLRSLVLFSATVAALHGEPATFASRVAPLLDRNCSVCHGAEKHKGGLRVDSYAALLKGGEDGPVIVAGNVKASDLHRRITLPPTDDEVMPSDGKPPLAPHEIKLLEQWIAAGAPETAEFDAPPAPVIAAMPPAAPDYTSRLAIAAELSRTLGVKLVPRSRVPTDGLVLRTASAPARCDDAALAKLAPLADLIVEAELARTKVTDAGVRAIASWPNLQRIDLARTAVTSTGVAVLAPLTKLESVNLTDTKVDDAGIAALQANGKRHVWSFGSAAEKGQ
jgi:hypothetical protein